MRNRPASESPVRKLIYFPIIHTQSDMGALSESLRRITVRKLGEGAWKRQVHAIERMWAETERTIDGLHLAYESVRLYQDGLPVCGREAEIVNELANVGSRNHRLLLRLMDKGATLMGSESSELLVEEYELVKQAVNSGEKAEESGSPSLLKSLGDALLARRDRYIADRINATLRPGETGILLLGMLHSLAGLLDEDINVVYPLTKPLPAR